ncbi:MAG: redoxin family protein [Sphingomicrobium sp.]
MTRALRFTPLLLLLLVVGALTWRLTTPADTAVPSRMTGQPVPTFDLAPLVVGKPGLVSADLASGKPRLLNIFASWCVPCIAEVKVLDGLRRRGVEIDGIAVRDRPQAVAQFLARNGDPYARIGGDSESRLQISLGSSGVPESFVVDGRGIVRYQHIGPIEAADVPVILAQLEQVR